MAAYTDTICALATGHPPAAIATIRVSGPRAREIAQQCLSKGCPHPRRATLDILLGEDGQEIDQGLMVFLQGPASYTGEDTLELTVHGGRAIIQLALKRLMACGARLAEPGEFTRRAFEAGKLDLTQAEAVADLIDAESAQQHRQALLQLGGALSKTYTRWRQSLTSILALLEVLIDFPDEEDAPLNVDEPVLEKLDALLVELRDAVGGGDLTQRIREGFRVAIIGAPNAGKSTLLNRFAGREAAIVTDIPGTTRDIVEVRLVLGGHLVWIADTAGLRETDDVIEQEGVRRARAYAQNADLTIMLHADSVAFRKSDLLVPSDIDVIHVINRADADGPEAILNVSRETFHISAKFGAGFEALVAELISKLDARIQSQSAPVITRLRHRDAVTKAIAGLEQAKAMLLAGYGAELVSEEIRLAARDLGRVTGYVDVEDILGDVFANFCIGK